MKEALDIILPFVVSAVNVNVTIVDHGSKKALLTNLPARLRAYRAVGNDSRVLALVDRDDDDCLVLKQRLETFALGAGLPTKTKPDAHGRFRVVNRIVVEELEAWFLGDADALCTAYPGVPRTLGAKARFRDPDGVVGGTWEALMRVLQNAGHYPGANRLPKIEVARRVSTHMTAPANRSRSFQAFVTGLQALLA